MRINRNTIKIKLIYEQKIEYGSYKNRNKINKNNMQIRIR